MTGLGAEAPEVEQGLDSEVEGAGTLHSQVLAETDQAEHVARQRQALIGRELVELADGGIAAIGRIVQVDLLQDCLDSRLHLDRGRACGLAHVLDAVAAAHGRATQALQGRALVAGGEEHQCQEKNCTHIRLLDYPGRPLRGASPLPQKNPQP